MNGYFKDEIEELGLFLYIRVYFFIYFVLVFFLLGIFRRIRILSILRKGVRF